MKILSFFRYVSSSGFLQTMADEMSAALYTLACCCSPGVSIQSPIRQRCSSPMTSGWRTFLAGRIGSLGRILSIGRLVAAKHSEDRVLIDHSCSRPASRSNLEDSPASLRFRCRTIASFTQNNITYSLVRITGRATCDQVWRSSCLHWYNS